MKSITTAQLLINGDRLNQNIARLAQIGKLPEQRQIIISVHN
jgi:hypothetical protein